MIKYFYLRPNYGDVFMKYIYMLLAVFIILSNCYPVIAHPGRTDAQGGHWRLDSSGRRIPGSYHFHGGGGTTAIRTVQPSSVRITRPSGNVNVGDSVRLNHSVSPSNATNTNVTWSSSNINVASVSRDGTLTANGAGTATITARTSNGRADSFVVTVPEIYATSIDFEEHPTRIEAGERVQLFYIIYPENTTNKTVQWESSDSSILFVSGSGEIRAMSVGVATITASTANGIEASSDIEVYEIVVDRIVLEIEDIKYYIDDIVNYSVTIYPNNATHKDYVITFSNPEAVELHRDGSFTLLQRGELTITVTARSGVEYYRNIVVNSRFSRWFDMYGLYAGIAIGGVCLVTVLLYFLKRLKKPNNL